MKMRLDSRRRCFEPLTMSDGVQDYDILILSVVHQSDLKWEKPGEVARKAVIEDRDRENLKRKGQKLTIKNKEETLCVQQEIERGQRVKETREEERRRMVA